MLTKLTGFNNSTKEKENKTKRQHGATESDHSDSTMGTALSRSASMLSCASSIRRSSKRKERSSPELLLTADSSDGEIHAKPKQQRPAKRGRSRPNASEKDVGLTKTRAELPRAQREESGSTSEEELSQSVRQIEFGRSAIAFLPADALNKEVERSVNVIADVAIKSKNLKGTFVRALKVATDNIRQSVAVLHKRTANEETITLRTVNADLEKEVRELREEVARLRADIEMSRTERTQAPPTPSTAERSLEDLRAALVVDLGFMMDAKLAGIEDRLLPATRTRPPLKGDSQPPASNSTKPGPSGVSVVKETKQAVQAKGNKKNKKKKNKNNGDVTSLVPETSAPTPLPTTPPAPTEKTWAKVVEEGRKEAVQKPSAGTQPPKKKKTKLHLPRSAVVVITVPEEAAQQGLTYEKVITQARGKIKLGELGIDGVKFRQAATGARILEIPGGGESAAKANLLASRLREVLPESVRVARPEKCASIRVTGLDDSITPEDILSAVAQTANCSQEHLKIGEMRVGRSGTGSVVLQCPVAAAKALTREGAKLLVGWSTVRVQSLEPRPLKCYRCLEIGHTGLQCKSRIDRSGFCFRCGKPGHKATTCTAAPHCPVCDDLNRPADHHVGGKKCVPAKRGVKKATRTPASTPEELEEEVMETGK